MLKAKYAKVILCEGIDFDGYMTDGGDFRLPVFIAAKLLGFDSRWLEFALMHDEGVKSSLRELGFTGEIEIVAVGVGGKFQVRTISTKDFPSLTSYGVLQEKQLSIALMNGLTHARASLDDFFRDAFNC